jgi:hypothetical protein
MMVSGKCCADSAVHHAKGPASAHTSEQESTGSAQRVAATSMDELVQRDDIGLFALYRE